MTPLTRSVAFLTAAPSASSSRTFFTNPTILAGASKGPAKKGPPNLLSPNQPTKTLQSYPKLEPQRKS